MKQVVKGKLLLLSVILMLASCANAPKSYEAPQYEKQAINLPGVPNARQLGGYVIGNKKIRMDLLLRSGGLANASDEAIETLHDKYRLALVADFRSSLERGGAPDRDVDGAVNVWLPVLEKMINAESNSTDLAYAHRVKDNPSYVLELLRHRDVQESLSGSYDSIVFDEDYQRSYAAFLDSLVALPEGRAALWHCSHGKDRCGWGTAFVLAALGADRQLMTDDFLMSNISYAKDIEYLASEDGADELIDYIYLLRGVSGLYFEKTLDEIDARCGSIENYLEKQLELSSDEKRILREKFLEDR